MASQWKLLRRSALLLSGVETAHAGLPLGLRGFGGLSAPKPRARGQFKGNKSRPQKGAQQTEAPVKTEPKSNHNSNNKHQKNRKRRGKKAEDQEPPVFTNKFQNLLSFAFEDVETPVVAPSTEPKTVQPRETSLDLLEGIGAAKEESPELTLAQLGLEDFNDDEDVAFTKRQPKHPRQKPKKTKLFTGDKDPSTVLAALGIPSDGEGDRMEGPPIGRKAMKMNTKRKKGTRNLLKNFQFENSIFDSEADLFGDIDWEERSDSEDRERRRSQRLQRKEAKRKPRVELPAQEVEIPTSVTVKDLAERMSVKTRVVFRALKDLGENGLNEESVLTSDIAELVVDSQNMIPVLLPPDFVDLELTTPPADCSGFPVRPPVVSVMGHVDHGKTTLLDALRKSKVAASEAGGITQRIGAFSVDMGKKFGSHAKVTFIDTPGHAAFSNMRSRGSELTDLLVLVVAADDGVRPQTVEVARLALKNNVPLIVAVTKMDMHEHDKVEVTNRLGSELLEQGIVVESMGGETPMVCVSGKTGEGLDVLKETIALHAEMLDLRADTKVAGEAIVLEANVARGVGTQVDTIVKWGTIKQGSFVVCGLEYGKVRALVDQAGKRVKQMTPGNPVRVIGLKGLPEGGVALLSVPTEDRAKEVVAARQAMIDWDQMAKAEDEEAETQENDGAPRRRRRFAGMRRKWEQVELRRREAVEEAKRVAALKPGDEGYIANVVPIIVKTDSVGVISAIDELVASLPSDEAAIKCIMSAVGPVTSSDLAMAEATGSTIYSFNLHPTIFHQSVMSSLPKTYKAAVFEKNGEPLVLKDIELKHPEEGQILVKVEACGVCHSDALVQAEAFGPLPRIPGHEIVGKVVEVGPHVTKWKQGDRVGGAWHGGHDGTCRQCNQGLFQMCDNGQINGVTRDGGYAEYCLLRSEAAVRLPAEGNAVDMAPIMCAGVTVHNGIRKMNITPGEVVAIQGLGGLGHLAVQYASKMGYRTVALSRGTDKKDFAMKLGAHEYIDTSNGDPAEALQKLGGAALIVATAPNPEHISPLVGGCRALGKLLILAPVGDVPVNSIAMITKGISVHGWPSGHALDSEDAVEFGERFDVKCMCETFPLAKANEAFEHMMSGKARFRAVLTM